MTQKLSFKTVKNLFESRGYELLETEYINAKTPMRYICPKHRDKGVQTITVDKLKYGGHGCKYCGKSVRLTFDEVKRNFEECGYELLETEYVNANTPMRYICKKHKDKGVQTTTAGRLRAGGRCMYCAGHPKPTYDEVKAEFAKHDYELLESGYINARTPMRYICNKHKNSGEQKICLDSLRRGHGCPACNSSKGEQVINDYLVQHEIKFNTQFMFDDCVYRRRLKFDFYLPTYNLCIEYDGIQHYVPTKFGSNISDTDAEIAFRQTQERDAIKNEFCIRNSINILRIPYWDFPNIEEILTKNLRKEEILSE